MPISYTYPFFFFPSDAGEAAANTVPPLWPTESEEVSECADFVGDHDVPSSICVLMPQDQLLTGVFRQHLMKHFSSAGNIDDYSLKPFIWKNGEPTDILIETHTRWTPTRAQLRPAIIIKRNDCAYVPVGIGDIRQGPGADAQGNERFVRYWSGSHTLFCIANTGAQAEILATEVRNEFSHFGPVLSTSLGLKRFRVLRVGAVAELEESSENYVVPITIGYAFEDRVVLRLNAPRLNGLSLSLILEGS